jgi:hypothetical protein
VIGNQGIKAFSMKQRPSPADAKLALIGRIIWSQYPDAKIFFRPLRPSGLRPLREMPYSFALLVSSHLDEDT